MSNPAPSRRSFFKASFAVSALASSALAACDADDDSPPTGNFPKDIIVPSNSQPEPKDYKPTKSVSITDFGGSASAADNAGSIMRAFEAAGAGGEVTIPGGNFAVASTLAWPNHILRLRGLGTADRPSVLAFRGSVAHGISVTGAAVGGSQISSLTFKGTSSAHVFFTQAANQQLVVDGCSFVDAPMYAIQAENAHLYIRESRFIGRADGGTTAVHAMKSGTKVTAVDTHISGCFRGLYCGGVDDITARGVVINAMWWCGNPAKATAMLASAENMSFTADKEIRVSGALQYTATAWQRHATGASLTPVAGKPGWYTLAGVSRIEPRLMVRTPGLWGTVLEAQGPQVRIHSFYEWDSCHPIAAPTSALTDVIVERPYIAGIKGMSSKSAEISDRWKAGANAAIETPPPGCRLTVVPAPDYQIFATDDTKAIRVEGCTVLNSWADSISTISSGTAYMSKNEIWDCQDVGITIQQGEGATRVENNTMHRIGTAGVFVGTSRAQVVGNSITGGQHTAVREDSYAPLQIEGAEGVAIWKNTVTYGNSPYELRGMIIEGRYGPFPQGDRSKGPFATNGYYKENAFVGYPKELRSTAPSIGPGATVAEVTVRGPHASAKIAQWAPSTRIQALDGADKSTLEKS